MGIRRLTLTRAIRVARGNDVACREAGDTKSTLISASWPSHTLSSMPIEIINNTRGGIECEIGERANGGKFRSQMYATQQVSLT